MLRVANVRLNAASQTGLELLAERVAKAGDFADQVAEGKRLWSAKPKVLFVDIRDTLMQMCPGDTRCVYCEDSLADEIEHIRPKDWFPNLVFAWKNYLLACGPCNGPKNNKYAIAVRRQSTWKRRDLIRPRDAAVEPPPRGRSAMIDPRREDPTALLFLDFGTFRFVPIEDRPMELGFVKAQFTIEILRLNRDVLLRRRKNAFDNFASRLQSYVTDRAQLTGIERAARRDSLRKESHGTVWTEMKRQREALPAVRDLFTLAPETLAW